MRIRLLTCTALLLGLAFPASSLAATTAQNVTAAVQSTLTLSATASSLSGFAYGLDGTGSSSVVVTSTKAAAWSLTVADLTDATTPGRMDKLTGTTGPSCTGGTYPGTQVPLTNALDWAAGTSTAQNGGTVTPDATGSHAMSATGTPAIASGTKNATVGVNYTQSVGQSEPLSENDCYRLSATYTVT